MGSLGELLGALGTLLGARGAPWGGPGGLRDPPGTDFWRFLTIFRRFVVGFGAISVRFL